MNTYELIQKIVGDELEESMLIEALREMAERGETAEEIADMARAMREHLIPVPIEGPLLDTCGTGGSGLPRFNTSTLVAFVVSADGVRVAKHGNRAASGRCGSFDLLEALGVPIELNEKQVAQLIEETNLGFLYARQFHPAMAKVAPLRQKIEGRTIFNLLGPLLNPAQATHQLLGTSDLKVAEKLAHALKSLGTTRALVVKGLDGLDEITLTGPTLAYELKDGQIGATTLNPEIMGANLVPFEAIAGGTTPKNTEIARAILENRACRAHRELVALNAGAALYVAGRVPSIQEGFERAQTILVSGGALDQFNRYKTLALKLANHSA